MLSANGWKALINDRYPLRSLPAKYFERINHALVMRAIWGGIYDHHAFDAQGFRHLPGGVEFSPPEMVCNRALG